MYLQQTSFLQIALSSLVTPFDRHPQIDSCHNVVILVLNYFPNALSFFQWYQQLSMIGATLHGPFVSFRGTPSIKFSHKRRNLLAATSADHCC